MFRYSPPKASVWGHTLGRMKSVRLRQGVAEFLGTRVGEHGFMSASLSVNLSDPAAPETEELLAKVGRSFTNLDRAQSERCLDELVAWEERHPKAKAPIVLSQAYGLKGWRIGEQLVPGKSMLMVYFGNLPALSTMFSFETTEHFEHVRQAMADLGLCKLNPKHLKPERARKSG